MLFRSPENRKFREPVCPWSMLIDSSDNVGVAFAMNPPPNTTSMNNRISLIGFMASLLFYMLFYEMNFKNCLNRDYPDLPDEHDFFLNSIARFWFRHLIFYDKIYWIPAFAGMTLRKMGITSRFMIQEDSKHLAPQSKKSL